MGEDAQEKRTAFGSRLRELRARLGLTQKEFAEKAGFTAATLSAYEAGQKSPAIIIASDIAEKFNVSLDWLCGIDSSAVTQSTPTIKDYLRMLSATPLLFGNLCIIDADNENTPGNAWVSFVNFESMRNFLSSLDKLSSLVNSGALDSNTYNFALSGVIENCARAIETELDEDVPF